MEECMLSELQKEEILELISLKQEGAYWDFKKEWYEEGKQPDLRKRSIGGTLVDLPIFLDN